MTEQIKVGDEVMLKSGGPRMTVEWIGENSVTKLPAAVCTWFDKNEKKSDTFAQGALEKPTD